VNTLARVTAGFIRPVDDDEKIMTATHAPTIAGINRRESWSMAQMMIRARIVVPTYSARTAPQR
jgi:hypothetical protein